jgi:hypothetical protein
MNDINNYRIVHIPIKGFLIEEKSKYFKNIDIVNTNRHFFGYGKAKQETIEVECWWTFHHPSMPKDKDGHIGVFETKEHAELFIKTLCSPQKYNYPPDFK